MVVFQCDRPAGSPTRRGCTLVARNDRGCLLDSGSSLARARWAGMTAVLCAKWGEHALSIDLEPPHPKPSPQRGEGDLARARMLRFPSLTYRFTTPVVH